MMPDVVRSLSMTFSLEAYTLRVEILVPCQFFMIGKLCTSSKPGEKLASAFHE
jgi:hypothetical protein